MIYDYSRTKTAAYEATSLAAATVEWCNNLINELMGNFKRWSVLKVQTKIQRGPVGDSLALRCESRDGHLLWQGFCNVAPHEMGNIVHVSLSVGEDDENNLLGNVEEGTIKFSSKDSMKAIVQDVSLWFSKRVDNLGR